MPYQPPDSVMDAAPEQIFDLTIEPDQAGDMRLVRALALHRAGQPENSAARVRIVRRSVDARARMPRFLLRVAVGGADRMRSGFQPARLGPKRAAVVGAGPAGYFAALMLLEAGVTPVILEQGRDARSRLKDIKKIYSEGLVHPRSNYCFGEGGAGTYSDGKLFTRSKKRGDVNRILDLFVAHGASEDILVDAHPHLGSNVLPGLVRRLRDSILAAGGEVRFGACVTDLMLDSGRVRGVILADGEKVAADAVILATGHSARDIYTLLHRKGIALEAKPFALGVRIEHPQELVDRMFYHHVPRHPALPAASYRIACQTEERGVFSFCMCPGGFVVPAATAPGELVLNGMSLASRRAPFANAGLVAEIRLSDVAETDPLALMRFQSQVERTLFAAGDGQTLRAPAQRAHDFMRERLSDAGGCTSYLPGMHAAPLHELLPVFVVRALRQALSVFGQRHRGFDSAEAMLLAVESRTSAPVRIPRDPYSLMHPGAAGLFPCGEGAGYAGGIMSAAMDGVAVARCVGRYLGT